MKCNLTLDQVMAKYVTGYTPNDWAGLVMVMLDGLKKDGGQWIWPNAQLIFTRNGNLYNVEKIKF